MTVELHLEDATAIAGLIASKAISPVEVVDHFLGRIERLNPTLNAFCLVAAESARAQAKRAEELVMAGSQLGPLHGVPVAIKDLTPTEGIETNYGSWIYKGNIPKTDAVLVERTKAAGGIVIGKTMTSELGHAACARDLIHGAAANPWNTERIPGGSSGGSAAAVAAGMVPVAEGSDGGGSVRIPAACCGLFGLKPQVGRIPITSAANFQSLACHGPLTWTVRDAALLMAAWSGPDDRDPLSLPRTGEDFVAALDGDVRGVRIAYSPDLNLPIEPDVRQAVAGGVSVLEALGAEVDVVDLDTRGLIEQFHRLWVGMEAAEVRPHLAEFRGRMTRGVLDEVARGSTMGALEYWDAELARSVYYEKVRLILDAYDFIVCPTLAVSPPSIHMFTDGPEEVAGQIVDRKTGWSMAYPFNMTMHPVASIPCGTTTDGMPVGMQIVGRRFGEAQILRLAARFEEAAPWARPPIALN